MSNRSHAEDATAPATVCAGTDLASRESIIQQGLGTFVEVGNALLAIREDGQYIEAGFPNFEAYCQRRWSLSRPQAYRLIDAATVQVALSPIGDRVPNESVARELAPLRDEPEKLREAYAEVKQRHGSTPTAAQVREVVRQAEPHMPPREKDEKGRSLDVNYVHADSADLNLRVIAFRKLVIQADRLLEPSDREDLMVNLDLVRFSLNDIEQALRPVGLRVVDGGRA